MRLAILGAGKIVNDLMSALAQVPAIEPVSILARPESRERVAGFAASHGIGRVETDLEACVSAPDVDVVYVGLPNDLHVEAARVALGAGKHVIMEKPFAPTLAEFDELAALAAKKGLLLWEAITTVHFDSFRALRAALPSIGPVRLVESVYVQRSSRWDAFLAGETPPAFDASRGGGALRDIGIYCLHVLVGLLGEPHAGAYVANVQRGVDTSGVATLTFADAIGVAVCGKDAASRSHTVVYGQEGTLELSGAPNAGGVVTLTRRDGTVVELARDAHAHRMVPEFAVFERMFREGDANSAGELLAHSRRAMVALERVSAEATA